jgi:hypothetical protein
VAAGENPFPLKKSKKSAVKKKAVKKKRAKKKK